MSAVLTPTGASTWRVRAALQALIRLLDAADAGRLADALEIRPVATGLPDLPFMRPQSAHWDGVGFVITAPPILVHRHALVTHVEWRAEGIERMARLGYTTTVAPGDTLTITDRLSIEGFQ